MIVYHFDLKTGAYTNTSSEVLEDPANPGYWPIPPYATPLVPPSVPNPRTDQQVFDGKAWRIEPKPVPVPDDPSLAPVNDGTGGVNWLQRFGDLEARVTALEQKVV